MTLNDTKLFLTSLNGTKLFYLDYSQQEVAIQGALSNDTGPAHLIAATNCKLHLVLSSFSNTKSVIPQSNNVTFSQSDNHINDIKTEKVLIFIDKILND